MSVYPRTEFTWSQDAQRNPWIADCDVVGCYYIVSAPTEQQAWADLAHHQRRTCPMTGGKAYLMTETDQNGQHYTKPHVGKSVLESLWDQADADFARAWALEGGKITHVETAKVFGICRGLAIAIQKMATPFYATPDDVVREIVRRAAQAKGEVEWAPTPGYQYNPPPPHVREIERVRNGGMSGEELSRRSTEVNGKKNGVQLTDADIDSIKKAHHAGGFAPNELASVWNVSTSRIKEVLGLT